MKRKSYIWIKKAGSTLFLSAALLAAAVMGTDSMKLAYAATTDASVNAAEFADYTQIGTAAELADMAKNPTGNYVLTNDIDMTGVKWNPFTFKGILEGNGYAVLNLNVTTLGTDTALTYDGNMKGYDTSFAGMFAILSGAQVNNLKLINETVNVNTTQDSFVGSMAGYMEDSTIAGCTISARLNITADAKMFGVGGIAGFGQGLITNTTVTATMICVDTNAAYKEEQFMGGAFGAGYINVDQCVINIDGYDSDHGYVHNGGITGMFQVYDTGASAAGTYLTNNVVNGKITFFEDNVDRRAYCSTIAGETMSWGYDYSGNTDQFVRDEVYDYSVNLKPDMCTNPTYKETVVEATPDSFGYTSYECSSCGYTYTDKYTIYQSPEELAAAQAATDQAGPIQSADNTGANQQQQDKNKLTISTILLIGAAVLVVIALTITFVNAGKKRKSTSRKRRAGR